MLNKEVQLDREGERIPPSQSKYIWLGPMLSSRTLPNVAPSADAASVPMRVSPLEAFKTTLSSLQLAVDNNYVPAFVLIVSAAMALHYELVMGTYGMCPAPVAIGRKNTGKSTAARAALSLLGTPPFFMRDFSVSDSTRRP